MRINVSGSGVSVGLGPPGANVNISQRGVRQTLGMPGTGLSHQTFAKWGNAQDPDPAASSTQVASLPPSRTGQPMWRNIAVIGGILALGFWAFSSNDKGPAPTAPATPLNQPVAAAPAVTKDEVPAVANRALGIPEVKEMQTLLKALGFDPSDVDGIIGPMTTAAVKRYEPSRGWPASGEVDLPPASISAGQQRIACFLEG